jgi:hypothetical protein
LVKEIEAVTEWENRLTEELRRDETSKCPERFSRRLACKANAESLREIGVDGIGENEAEVGERRGEGGEASLLLELVAGRWSDPRLFGSLAWRNALKTWPLVEAIMLPMSVKDVEFRLTRVARVDDAAWLL